MAVFKPTKEEWAIIKTVAARGAVCDGLQIKSPAGVQLECRESYNVEDGQMPLSINMMLTSHKPYEGCGDCDLNDRAVLFTYEFRAGAPLNEGGDGLFDFYIYNRYERGDGNLCGNILVEIRDGQMSRIWIEGGNNWSWTPETGIVPVRLRRND